MEHNSCVICQSVVTLTNQIDIQLTTTELGQINVEEFLKETILDVNANIQLHSNYLCQQCYAAVNTLEDHFITYKSIQDSLKAKYLEGNALSKVDSKQETNELKQLEVTKTIDSEIKEEEITTLTTTPEVQERKSSRKRKSIPNYQELQEELSSHKIKKKTVVKKSSLETKLNSDNDDEFSTLAANPEYCCEICGKQYLNYNGFSIHRRKHRNEHLIRCEYCNKTFAQKGGLRRHLHRHTGTFPYECDLCDKKFIHPSSLKIHKDIHDGRRDHICEICAMAFYSKTDLKRHINRHTKETMFRCEVCGTMFTEKYNLNVHIQKVHGIKA